MLHDTAYISQLGDKSVGGQSVPEGIQIKLDPALGARVILGQSNSTQLVIVLVSNQHASVQSGVVLCASSMLKNARRYFGNR